MGNKGRLYALSLADATVIRCSRFIFNEGWNQIDNTAFSSLESFLSQAEKNSDLLIVPPLYPDTFVLTTAGIGEILCNHYKFNEGVVEEVKEYIDFSGRAQLDLFESEINPVLRKVFQIKPRCVYINLLNGFINSRHESILKNILALPGYNSLTTTDQLQ